MLWTEIIHFCSSRGSVTDNHMGEFVQFIRSDLVPLRCTKLQKISAGVADSPGKFLGVEIRHRHEVTELLQTINEFNSHFLNTTLSTVEPRSFLVVL